MKRIICGIVLSVFVLAAGACTPLNFEITPTGDKFSDPNAPYGMAGMNNRLSTKSSRGGLHIDRKGVYLNPFVYKDRKSNKVTDVGFHVAHFSFGVADGFSPLRQVIFLTDKNERIAFDVISYKSDFHVQGWNKVSRQYDTTFDESGMGYINNTDFYILSHANFIEVKIVGDQLSQTYNKKDVSPDFLPNLRKFFDTAINQ